MNQNAQGISTGCTDVNPVACTTHGGCTLERGGINNANLHNIEFTIGAIGNIGGQAFDQWTMGQNKELSNTINGIE